MIKSFKAESIGPGLHPLSAHITLREMSLGAAREQTV
jgi:hypothetical protein